MSSVIHMLITVPLNKDQLAYIQSVSADVKVHHYSSGKLEEIPIELWDQIEILFTSEIFPPSDTGKNIKWVQSAYAGVDGLVKQAVYKNEAIKVTSMSGANSAQVAEHAVALLLSLARKLPDLYDLQIRTKWLSDREGYQPVSLRNSTVGIVGYGSVGREVARLLSVFGVTILATKNNLMKPDDTEYTLIGLGDSRGEIFERLYPPEALKSMLKQCDFVVVATPLTEKTRNLISEAEIDSMKPGVILVDVSRGGVVDHEVLIEALQDRKLGGLGLDVFPQEPLPVDSILWEMPNVIITPHVAGMSQAYWQQATELFGINLRRYLSGDRLLNLVDKTKGY